MTPDDPHPPHPPADNEPGTGARHSQVTRSAVALAYRAGQTAPKVVAKGRGLIADEIIARAREHGVYLHESRELVSLLMQVDLDTSIPPTLYRAVAELLAWLYRMENGLTKP